MESHVDFTDEKNERQIILPVPTQLQPLWDLYKQQEAQIWKREEIDFTQDIMDWKSSPILTPKVKSFIMYVIGFFAVSDTLVINNLVDQFMTEVKVPECKFFYSVQSFIEAVHSETYAVMLQLFSKNGAAITASPAIQGKAKWAQKYMDSSMPFTTRLWAFCVFEGVLFQASFASMFWLKRKGVCPGITSSNEFISRDEALHAEFAATMLNMCKVPISRDVLYDVVREAVQCEEAFVREALEEDIMGMTKDLLIEYVHFSADRILGLITNVDDGYIVTPLYNQQNPFKWMEMTDLDGKTNFFERRVTEYESSTVGQDKGDSIDIDEAFNLEDEDF